MGVADALRSRVRGALPAVREAITGMQQPLRDLVDDADVVETMPTVAVVILTAEALREAADRLEKEARAALGEAMAEVGAPAIRIPHFTVVLVEPKPKPVVSDLLALPPEFLAPPKPQEPKPDYRAIEAALKRGPVPGVTIANGGAAHVSFRSRSEA